MKSILEKNEEKLRNLKDVKTLMDLYKTTREYKQQVKEEGILSFIINKITEELLEQIEPYYTNSIIRNIQIQTQVKQEQGTVEVSSKIDLKASLKPYVEFTIEVNGKRSFQVRFTFQIKTSGYVTKLKFARTADQGKSIHIERLGIDIEIFLLRVEFSDLDRSSSDISLDKSIKLGSRSFEIKDFTLYTDSQAEHASSRIAQTDIETSYNNEEEDPLLIIQQRLARGEITIEEYERLHQALKR
jgi:hypothetical protein